MPVVIHLAAEKGWKTALKNQQIRGDVVVMKFLNELNHENLFTYAPKWIDIPIFLDMIDMMVKYEKIKQKMKINGVKINE